MFGLLLWIGKLIHKLRVRFENEFLNTLYSEARWCLLIILSCIKFLQSTYKNFTVFYNCCMIFANIGENEMIPRSIYLENLISFKDEQLIKVITGIRRCGKSTLLEIYQEHLLDRKEQICSETAVNWPKTLQS